MAEKGAEIEDHSIVLIGDFNPRIFQPAWLAYQKLIREQESENAEIEIITREIVIYRTEWFRLSITIERFTIETSQAAYYEPLRDLVLGIFKILNHTPIKMMGINFNAHYRVRNEEKWHELGHKLAPKDIWKKVFINPGMRSLIIEEKKQSDKYKGYIQVKVEPSLKIQPGIYIGINDHYEKQDADKGFGAEEIIKILEIEWDNSRKRASDIVDKILEE